MSLSESFTTSSILENNYKLALKFFMNKNFNKSFEILHGMYPAVFTALKNDTISGPTFTKIINLYLIEVGLYFQGTENFKIPPEAKTSIKKDLHDDKILNDLFEHYQDVNRLPMESLYNLFLIYYITLDLKAVYAKFQKIYSGIDTYGIDVLSDDHKYLRKLVELFVLKVLPELDQIDDAIILVNETPLILNKQDYMTKLNAFDQEKRNKKDHEAKLKQQREVEQKKRDNQKKLDKNLKYRSLKQIKEESEPREPSPQAIPPAAVPTDLNGLRTQLLRQVQLVRHFLKDNSPLILLVIAVVFVSARVLRARKINLMQNVKQTLQMAFKISYL